MAAAFTREQGLLLAWSVFQIAVVTVVLNAPSLFYDPLFRWVGIVTPMLLAVGLAGALVRRRWMLYFGWAGVGLFFCVVLLTAIPSEEYTTGGPNAPNFVAGDYALGRLLLLLGAGISLAVCFRSWAKMLKSTSAPSV